MKAAILVIILVGLPSARAFAAAPDPNVKVVADQATRKSCRYLGLVTVRKSMGTDKAGGALRKAMRKVAEMGGNGLFIVGQSQTWTEGASVDGEALLCPNNAAPDGSTTPP